MENEVITLNTMYFKASKRRKTMYAPSWLVMDNGQLPSKIEAVSTKTKSVAVFEYLTYQIDCRECPVAWIYVPTQECLKYHPQLEGWKIIIEKEY